MNHRLLICLLAALSMMGALSIDAYLPALPSIAEAFGATSATVQQTLTVYLFAFAFMSLFYGTLSDSLGRRPVILASLALYFFSSIGAGCATGIGWLLFFRVLQGLSAGAGAVVGDAIVVDLLAGAEAQRAMSYIAALFGIAPAIAPMLGGWLQAAFGWRAIFFFIAFFTLILFIACVCFLPESLARRDRHPFRFTIIVSNYRRVASHGRFVLRCLGNALMYMGIFIYVGAAPNFVMKILHLSVREFGWLFIPIIGGMTIGSYLSGRLSHRYSPAAVIGAGYALQVAAALSNLIYNFVFPASIPWAIVPLFFCGLGMALATPAMTIRILQMFPNDRGLAASLLSSTVMAVFAVGSGIICPFLFDSALHLAWSLVAGVGLSSFFWCLGTWNSSDQPKVVPV